jgi:hypothetical protein
MECLSCEGWMMRSIKKQHRVVFQIPVFEFGGLTFFDAVFRPS